MPYCKGKILLIQVVSIVGRMTNVMKDLQQTSFCIPLVDKYSPIAYKIENKVYRYSKIAKHAGIKTVLQYTLSTAYIIQGRIVVKRIKKTCHRCSLFAKRTVDVSKSPVSDNNLIIAPNFYYTQVDLQGHSKHIHSTTRETQSKYGYVHPAAQQHRQYKSNGRL